MAIWSKAQIGKFTKRYGAAGAEGLYFQIKGQEKLRQFANNLARVNVENHAKNAILAGSFRIEKTIRAVTPVDTGFLRSSIRTKGISRGARIAEHSFERSGISYGFYVHKKRPFFDWGLEKEQATLDDIGRRAGIKISTEILRGV